MRLIKCNHCDKTAPETTFGGAPEKWRRVSNSLQGDVDLCSTQCAAAYFMKLAENEILLTAVPLQ